MTTWSALCLASLLVGCRAVGGEDGPGSSFRAAVVAVLEDGELRCEAAARPAIRPIFAFHGDGWAPIVSVEDFRAISTGTRRWRAVDEDGAAIASVGSSDDLQSLGVRLGLLDLEIEQQASSIHRAETRSVFGWCSRSPAVVPRVVVPDKQPHSLGTWKTASAGPLTAALFDAFRSQVGDAHICAPDSTTRIPWTYRPSDVVVTWSFVDQSGRKLVGMELDDKRNNCDGPPEAGWHTHAFLVAGQVQTLGQDLTFLDAGDFNGDGRQETIFWYSGHNEDGYEIFDADFRTPARYSWKYH